MNFEQDVLNRVYVKLAALKAAAESNPNTAAPQVPTPPTPPPPQTAGGTANIGGPTPESTLPKPQAPKAIEATSQAPIGGMGGSRGTTGVLG